MNMQLVNNVGKKFMKKVPIIKPGSTVKVHQRIQEGNKERVQVFEGLVIAVNSGTGPNKTFTVRKIVDGIGVEKIFPLYSKNITKINVTKSSDIRRSKLYYMRKRSGKSARLKEKHLTESEVKMEEIEGIGDQEEANEKKSQEEPEVKTEEKAENKSGEKPEEKPEEKKEEVATAQEEKPEEKPEKKEDDNEKKD